jgi:hypothetical protein
MPQPLSTIGKMMRATPLMYAAILALTLTACEKAAAPVASGEQTADVASADANGLADVSSIADWTGKWNGPEGMYADISQSLDGKIMLEMQSDLDTKGSYEGTKTSEGISFSRGDETLVLKKSSGDATGLKYLAGKKDCVIVKSGEGYCRD